MPPPCRSSVIQNSKKTLDAESEHGQDELMERLRNDWEKSGEIPVVTTPESYFYQQKSRSRNFVQAGFLLLSLLVFHNVYFGPVLPRMVKPSNAQEQTQSLHFSTPNGTRNVPIGLFVDDDKTWHIYFQSTLAPNGVSDYANWGHATSYDLYTWSIQPIAFQGDDFDICGGSVVIDRNNTSGFFPHQSNGVVALYAQRHPATGMLQQAIAYSVDGGYLFTKYSKSTGNHVQEEIQDLRDPKVIWHEPTLRWVMSATKATDTAIGIYTSSNLIDWALASEFTNQDLIPTHGFELPSLVSIPRIDSTGAENPNWPTVPGGVVRYFGDYMLLCSANAGSPLNGGSTTRYFPGTINGTHFQPIDNRADRFIDFGPDNYASQFFFGLPEGMPVVSVGLATNLGYTTPLSPSQGCIPTSTFTIPREGYLIHGPDEGDLSYVSRPVSLDSLRGGILASLSAQNLSDFSVLYKSSEAVLVEMRFDMQPPDDEVVELNVDFIFGSSKSSGHILCTIVFRTWIADFGCDRSQESSNGSIGNSLLNQMSAYQVRPLLPFHNPAVRRWETQLVMDRSMLEVFLNNGVRTGTMRTFSELSIDTVGFQSSKIPTWATLSVDVQRLRPERSVLLPPLSTVQQIVQ